jgi:hypothetical protein
VVAASALAGGLNIAVQKLDERAHEAALSPERARAAFLRLPLSFEANAGQIDPAVDYIARGSGYLLALKARGAAFVFGRGKAATSLRAELVGGNADAKVLGQGHRAGKVNYYVGTDESKWLSAITTVGRVTYKGVYPGIDVTYYGNQHELEYDFIVAPGARPRAIKVRYSGGGRPQIDAAGRLVVATRSGRVVQARPIAYQRIGGVRHGVSAAYRVDGNEVGLALGAYDHRRPLVIDPTLTYSTFLGGNGEDPAYGTAVDPAGNVYVTGVTNSMTPPYNTTSQQKPFPLMNPFLAECCGGNDTGRAFVTKMNPTGTALIFSTYFGGFAGYGGVHRKCPSLEGCGGAPGYARGWDTGHSIGADTAGNAYVGGWAESLDFPTTADAARRSHPGPKGCSDPTCYAHDYLDHPRDAFVAKFGPTGALLYSSLIGGRGSDGGMAIEVVDSGPGQGVYVGGLAQSPDFFANDSLTPAGGTQHYPAVNSFQSKLNVNSLHVTNPNPPESCHGATPSVDWSCWRDAFVMRLNFTNLGGPPLWSTLLGGTADDGLYGISVNRSTGDAVVVGETESTDWPSTANAYQPCLGRNGGYHAEFTLEPAADTPFPCHKTPTPAVGEADSTNKPNVDAMFAKISPSGALLTSSYLGGSLDDDSGATLDDKAGDFGKTVALDGQGNIYVTGWTESTSTPAPLCGPLPNPDANHGNRPCPHTQAFPTTTGAYMEKLPQDPKDHCDPGAPNDCEPPNLRLHANPFVTKLNPDGTALVYGTYLGGYGDDAAFGIAVDSAGQAYITGVADSTNFPGTAQGTIPGFPNTRPTGKYVTHPNCPLCGSHLNGVPPPYNSDTPPQSSDAFITKMNAAGNGLIYSSYLGGSGDDVAHGLVHSTRAGSHGVYLSGLTGSQDTAPPPEPCLPGQDPCPPPPPNPWFKFPVTPDAFQPVHAPGRTQRCDGKPANSEEDDYPCSPLPANPSEDAFIVRLNDNADESPAPPVGTGPTAPDFMLSANPSSTSIPLAGPGAGTGSFSLLTSSVGGYHGTVSLSATVTPSSGLTVTPTSASVPWGGTSYPARTFNLSSSTPGTYTVSIKGTAGTHIHTLDVPVKVEAPDFSLTLDPTTVSFPQAGPGSGAGFKVLVTAIGGLSQAVTIRPAATPGLTFSPASRTVSPGATGTFIVTASTPGARNVPIRGSCAGCGLGGSNLAHTVVLPINARPKDFTLAATPSSVTISRDGASATFGIKPTPIDNFTGTVTLTHAWTGTAPTGVTVTPTSATSASPGFPSATFTVTSVAGASPGTFTLKVTGTGGSPSLTRPTNVTVVVPFNTGWRSPTANSSANTDGDGDGFEVNATRAYAGDGLFAVDNNSGVGTGSTCTSQNKDSHRFSSYGVTVPTGKQVSGIEVRLEAKVDSPADVPKMCVDLSWNGGTSWTTAKSTPLLTASEGVYTLGLAGDTWGRSWTAAQLSNSNFRIRITNVSSSTQRDFSLDWVAAKVHYR